MKSAFKTILPCLKESTIEFVRCVFSSNPSADFTLCTDRSPLFGIELQSVLHSRVVCSTADSTYSVAGRNHMADTEVWPCLDAPDSVG